MKKHFVTFYSPGTFVSERSTKEIESWDISVAKKMAETIVERHNAIPYGFQFLTKERGDEDFDSKETARSNMYYTNCRIETLPIIILRNDPADKILIENMQCNGWDRVVRTVKGWKGTFPLQEGDVVL